MIAHALLLASAALAAAQDEELGGPAAYPEIAAGAGSAHDFAPRGWTVEKRVEGDLDRDGRGDLVLVLHETDPVKIVKHDGLGENPLDTNPRMLIVALREGAGYRRVAADTALIPRRQSPTFDDPLGAVEIRGGVLRVSLGSWASAGSWEMSSRTFSLRVEKGALRLIGFDRNVTMRNSGETTDISINFLTGRVKRATGSIEHDMQTVTWSALPGRKVIGLADVGDGLAFDPLGEDAR